MDNKNRIDLWLAAGLALLAGVLFYLSTKATQAHFDYTFRVAQALLRGHAGLNKLPPSWLNEFVPLGGRYYSVFPLGAVLASVPAAILRKMGLIHDWPARVSAAFLAAASVYFFYRLSFVAEMSRARRILLALFPVFGTWTWANLGLAGAWQVALGVTLAAETASLYFTLVRPRPLLAGFCFALAFGNRVEVILTLPIFLYFWFLQSNNNELTLTSMSRESLQRAAMQIARFLVVPALLLLATAIYNYARFGSLVDFGYARIPGVLKEPWYRHGLFSFHAIPWNAYEMLFKGLADMPQRFPYLRADPFGCSIFMASPFLFLLFREGGKHKVAAWLAIAGLTLVLWLHGNPGGWQFSYRYAMIMLPWMFLLIAENGPARLTSREVGLFIISVLMNAMAVYEFIWANLIHV